MEMANGNLLTAIAQQHILFNTLALQQPDTLQIPIYANDPKLPARKEKKFSMTNKDLLRILSKPAKSVSTAAVFRGILACHSFLYKHPQYKTKTDYS